MTVAGGFHVDAKQRSAAYEVYNMVQVVNGKEGGCSLATRPTSFHLTTNQQLVIKIVVN